MTPEDRKTLAALEDLLASAYRERMPVKAFWERFDAIAGDLEDRAFAKGADPDLTAHYHGLLADADGGGFSGPNARKD